MPVFIKHMFLAMLCLASVCFLSSCSKEVKKGSLEITQTEYVIEHNAEKTSISLNVKGKVRNTGLYDIKNIVITGQCKSCSEEMISGKWFVTQQVKRDNQLAKINYLPAGAEEAFSFEGIAYYFRSSKKETPETHPDGLKVYVQSFETIQN